MELRQALLLDTYDTLTFGVPLLSIQGVFIPLSEIFLPYDLLTVSFHELSHCLIMIKDVHVIDTPDFLKAIIWSRSRCTIRFLLTKCYTKAQPGVSDLIHM